ncbi:MAG: glycosyltransferase family 4 protein [Chloroflexi bacterium]|nr:glycosyltransferase family 4 protein [Chloroflexota bacterium]
MNGRLGLITYGVGRAPGGIGRYTQELRAGLQGLGVEPVLLHAGRAGSRDGALALPGAGLVPGLLSLGQAEIAWVAWRHRLALVHDPTGIMPLLVTGARRVVTIHDVVPYIYPETSTALDWLIYRFWLPLAARRVQAIVTVSGQSKADIVRYLPLKLEDVTVIPEAASPKFRPMSREDIQPALARYGIGFPYILYVGSMEARKNLPRLLEAYTRLREWSDKWRLVIAGARKWKFESTLDTVRRLGLEAHVHFTGFVEEEDLPALYNGADLFVFPSLYEGFGLPALEAMACGTPVVASNASSLPEVAGDGAILVDPYDVEAIAAGMQRVLGDPALAQELQAKALVRARSFTWERTARETLAVYERVLGQE